jgi:imidazolonepropionase-like amidohydrolase
MKYLIAALGFLVIAAQKPDPLTPHVYAIRDARVVTEPGKVLQKATVVIRDGLIEAVGADVKPPADALVIDGKGLTVYPGFIDGLSHWGIDLNLRRPEGGPPAAPDTGSDALIATPPDQRKGIMPEFMARSAFKTDEEQTTNWRKLGFTCRLAAPEGPIIGGQAVVVSLSGASARESLLNPNAGLFAAFRTPPGNEYPRSLMGVFAHVRQTLLDAQHYQRAWDAFDRSGGKGKRPPTDPALSALRPCLEGKLPVIFEVDSRDEIGRALNFAEEFKLRPIIFGGRDAWKIADRLAATRTPVLLRLTFSDVEKKEGIPQRVTEDRERRRKDELHCAARLQEKGVAFAFSTQGLEAAKFRANLRLIIEAGLSAENALRALTSQSAELLGIGNQVGTIAPGKAAHLTVMDDDFHEADAQVKYIFSDGIKFEFEVKPKASKPVASGPKAEATGSGQVDKKEIASEIDADRVPKIRTGGDVLLTGATLLTVSNGTKPNTDLLVRGGKIVEIGPKLKAPQGVKVIDARGMFIMPGIIDTHSHFAISGGVNEFSLSVVPEVRVRDVINSEDVQIYRGLAGGVTTARLLHGSANVVGGQDAVIKLKYGEPSEKLLIADAPRGVKFALGENVKRSDGRFPNSRLGVEAVLIRAFTEAQEDRKKWDEYEKSKTKEGLVVPQPRRDLRLEALADVLRGDLKIHCHCYRADEILMLLRTANRFGFKVKSLQHVLEGYKIAAEIADHGASCSLFSDWWAYKIEAFDAIPYAGAILHRAGVDVCLKSDSHELMRHLHQEAAKLVKYGGLSEEDALKSITLNPAKQLGLEKRIGALDVGKDADLAIFNGHPLNSFSRVDMALIDGEVFFQRSEKLTPFAAAASGTSKPVITWQVPGGTGSYILHNATVHPVSGPAISPAVVIIENGKVGAIHKGLALRLDNREKPSVVLQPERGGVLQIELKGKGIEIDATGLHLYPGMIDAGTVLGLTELGSAKETIDYADSGDFQPDLRASTGINPDSELIPVTRANGVTTVVTRPTGAIIAGQSALINLAGWVPKEMTIIDPLALHIDFPPPAGTTFMLTDPNGPNPGKAIARKQRDEKVRKLKELFAQAKIHDASRKGNPAMPGNPRLEALAPYARGDRPVIIQAQRKDEIMEAIKLADELKIRMILSGGIDSWKVAAELKKRDIPVIVGPLMAMPSERYDPYDAPYACAAKLHQAGVRFCIRSSGGSNTRNLPYEAAMAVSYGLPPEEGLKAVTLYPAQILGVEKELGRISTGKRANLVLTNGDILQASTQVLGLFIDGKPLPPTSKHTRLYERYLERLKEVQDGRAPLGTK